MINGQFKGKIKVISPANQFAWNKQIMIFGQTSNQNPVMSRSLTFPVAPADPIASIVHPKVENNRVFIASSGLDFEITFTTNMKWQAISYTDGSKPYISFTDTSNFPITGIPTDVSQINTIKVHVDPRQVNELDNSNIYADWRVGTIKIRSTAEEVEADISILEIYQAPLVKVGFFDNRSPEETVNNPEFPYLPQNIAEQEGLFTINLGALAVESIPETRNIVSPSGPYTIVLDQNPQGADAFIHDSQYRLNGNLHQGIPTLINNENLDVYHQIDFTTSLNNTGAPRNWTVQFNPGLLPVNSQDVSQFWETAIPVQDTIPEQLISATPLQVNIVQDSIPIIHLNYNNSSEIMAGQEGLSGYLDVTFTGAKYTDYPWEFTTTNMKNKGVDSWSPDGSFDNPEDQWTFDWNQFPTEGFVKDGQKLYFNILPNSTGEIRTAEYKVRLNILGYPNTQEAIVTVTQEALDSLQVNWDTPIPDISSTGGTSTITIRATGATNKTVQLLAYSYADETYDENSKKEYTGITFSPNNVISLTSGVQDITINFLANPIAKNKYLKVKAVKSIEDVNTGTSEIPYKQIAANKISTLFATQSPDKELLICGNTNVNNIEFTYKANFDFKLLNTFSNTSSTTPGEVIVTDDNYDQEYVWNLKVNDNLNTFETLQGNINLYDTVSQEITNSLTIQQYGIYGKVGYWEMQYETNRNDGGEAKEDDRINPPYSNNNTINVTLPNIAVTSAIPELVSLVNPNIINPTTYEPIGIINTDTPMQFSWTTDDTTIEPKFSNGWCTAKLVDWNVPSSPQDGVYNAIIPLHEDLNIADNWPHLALSCTENTSSVVRETALVLKPFIANLPSVDFGELSLGSNLTINISQERTIPIEEMSSYSIHGQLNASSTTPLLVHLYGYDDQGHINSINNLPVNVYAYIEYEGMSMDGGVVKLIETSGSILYAPEPAVANATIIAIAFDETGPFKDGEDFITKLTWNNKIISINNEKISYNWLNNARPTLLYRSFVED